MILSARIDNDCRSLNRYFHLLFDVLRQAIAEDQAAPLEVHDVDAVESQATYHRFSHLIKPDMLINLYGLVDFWMKEICKYQKSKNNLSLNYTDIKGDNDLHAYQKYLTKCAGLDLSAAQISYTHLVNLSTVRNQLVHRGGHVPDDKKLVQKFSAITGVVLSESLIVIDDRFVWDALDHAKKYLYAAAQA
jgi:hypothetical protein